MSSIAPHEQPDPDERPAERQPSLTIHLCAPRGFCAGVDRAIQIVELALEKHGPPIYVRHEIVHNRHVVESLKAKGVIFVETLEEIPACDAPVIFSAHGVAKSVIATAAARNMLHLDATCPLVSKVHMEAQRLYKDKHEILLIGHAGHPEVIGTMGQLPSGEVTLIENAQDAHDFIPRTTPDRLAFITQTTLSVDDTQDIVNILKARFPDIKSPPREDICYATTNRQNAVKKVAPACEAMIVIGSPNSSNSQRLREVAERAGCPKTLLIQCARELEPFSLFGLRNVGLTASASAPEILVEEVIEMFRAHYTVTMNTVTITRETISFNLPRTLRAKTA